MKIAHINVGSITVPPKGWGAIEEVIWNYQRCLEAKGHTVDIRFPADDLSSYDIVHVHTHNQAHMIAEKGVPYFFTAHDIHAVVGAKAKTQMFMSNQRAIEESILTFVPGKFAINTYGVPSKVAFLSHGVDNSFYEPPESRGFAIQAKLLCVGKNQVYNEEKDRKGFGPSVEVARELDLSITLAGPNEEWVKETSFNPNYSKVTILNENLEKKELRDLYAEHGILMHLATVETGQPCLVILEAMAMGMPIITTSLDQEPIPGVIFVDRSNSKQIVDAIHRIRNDYHHFSSEAYQFAQSRDWKYIVDDLEKFYIDKDKFETQGGMNSMYEALKRAYSTASHSTINYSEYENREVDSMYTLPSGEEVDLATNGAGASGSIYKEIFVDREYEFGECSIQPGDVVVDLGANVGVFSRYAYAQGAKSIYAFEPEPNNYECLMQNKPPNCFAYNLGISSSIKAAGLRVDSTIGGHTLFDSDPNGSRTNEIIPVGCINMNYVCSEICRCPIDFLKIDVEGAEFLVFQGMSVSNLRRVRKIAMEYHRFLLPSDEDPIQGMIYRFNNNGFKHHVKYLNGDGLQMIFFWR